MTNSTTTPSKAFYTIGGLALIWNLMGINQYLQQAFNTDAFRAEFNEEQLLLIDSTPAWVTAAFAIAVFGGTIGCVLFLMRRKAAKNIFIVSLLGIVIQMYYNLFIIDSVDIYGPGAAVMTFMILGVALFLVTYATFCYNKGWLSK